MKKKMLITLMAVSVFFSSAVSDTAVLATEVTEVTETTETTEITEATEATEVTETTEATEETESTEVTEVTEATEVTEETESTETTEETETTEATEVTEETESTEVTEETEVTEATEVTEETESIEIVIEDEIKSEEKQETEADRPTGFMQMQEMTLATIGESQIYEPEEGIDVESAVYGSSKYNSDWDKYSTNYFYNQLNSAQRKAWDALDEMCLSYLTGTEDALETEYTNKEYKYATEFVDMGDLTDSEASKLVQIFRFSNPQYYFLNTIIWSSNSYYGDVYKAIGVYSSFADGDKRKSATAKVKKQAESWVNQAAKYSTEEQKAKVLHDLVVNNVDYNYDLISGGTISMADEDSAYSQSAYSVFCTDLTVCAGYSQAYEMVCNAAGLDCISVTSTGHEWNKIRLNDSWYNVDCTWADEGDGYDICYLFYERNDSFYDNYDSNHAEESLWEGYLPVCKQDSNPSGYYTAGKLPSVKSTTATPAISISDGKATITSSTSGATIYYTTDGSTPSPAATKSLKYKGKFKVATGKTVKAIAVSDGKWDSDVRTVKNAKVTYTIVFKGNGSTSGKMAQQKVTYGSGKKITANAFKKKGYTFTGWNTKADGSGKSYKNKADGSKLTKTSGKTVKLYAQWKANKYTIKYNGNGSTSGKMSAKKNCQYGKKYKLAANSYKKKGYTFAGWNTKKDGSGKSYKNKAQVKNLTTKSGGTVTLYAQWKKK